MIRKTSTYALALAIGGAVFATTFTSAAEAQRTWQYEVSITNITPGQTFTPQLLVTHNAQESLFELGEEASEGLEILAEGGDTSVLTDEVANVATDAVTIGGLLEPGASVSMVISGNPWRDRLSLAAMLIPTNDTFVAVDGVRLPARGSQSYMAVAYDAGTEVNDQDCANMPGPRCGGEGFSEADGEGFVHVSNGFHSLPQVEGSEVLGPAVYDWRNPVAIITVRRLR